MKFEFFFRLKHKWHFTLFTSSCLSLFELGILVYILERLAWSHINTYQSLVWTYDHLFKYIFIGFNRALSDFQEASPPSEKLFAQIEAQKVLFSLIIISALISFRHMVLLPVIMKKVITSSEKSVVLLINILNQPKTLLFI